MESSPLCQYQRKRHNLRLEKMRITVRQVDFKVYTQRQSIVCLTALHAMLIHCMFLIYLGAHCLSSVGLDQTNK